MSCEIEIIRNDQMKVSKWAGGMTTELAIFRKIASYSERNFKWRLSKAIVEVEESVFTSLPNINRIIMIIKGNLMLEHDGHHKSILKPFDQDHFSGNWITKSFGKVVDFNLMMSENCTGELEAIHLEKEQVHKISIDYNKEFPQSLQAIYCVNGQVKIENVTDDIINLYEGDIILVSSKASTNVINLRVYNESERMVDLIKTSIRC